jgi:DNA-binding GntR family transcriptional regulator
MPPKPPEPASVTVDRELRKRLDGMESGQQLASVADLAAQYGAARRTVQKVLARLAAEDNYAEQMTYTVAG